MIFYECTKLYPKTILRTGPGGQQTRPTNMKMDRRGWGRHKETGLQKLARGRTG